MDEKKLKPVFTSKRTAYFEASKIPKKYSDELDAVFENVKAIHGAKFVQHVKFLLNFKSLVGMMIQNTHIREDVDEDRFREAVENIMVQLTASHAAALDVDDDHMKAAMNTIKALDNVVESLQDEINKEK